MNRTQWKRFQEQKRTDYLRSRGLLANLPPERPLFFTGSRGCAFGRRPVGNPPAPQPSPKPESADRDEKQD
jgi:hypothetical protein